MGKRKSSKNQPKSLLRSIKKYQYNFYASAVLFAFIAYPLAQLLLTGEVAWGERGIDFTVQGVHAKVFALGPLFFIMSYVSFTMYKVYRHYYKI